MKCSNCGNNIFGNRCDRCGMFTSSGVNIIEDERQNEEKPKELPDFKTVVIQVNKSDEPTILTKGANLSRSLFHHAKDGFKNVESDLQKRRLEICQKCEYYKEDNISCKKCGCYLLIKTSWASESCPVGKWGSENHQKPAGGCGGCGGKKT
jgi:ribosomal protein L32